MSLRSWLVLCRQVSLEDLNQWSGLFGGCQLTGGLFPPRLQMVRHVPMPNNNFSRPQRWTLYVIDLS